MFYKCFISVFISVSISVFKCFFPLLFQYPGFFSGGMVARDGPKEEDIAEGSFVMTMVGQGYSTVNSDPAEQHQGAPDVTAVTTISGPGIGCFASRPFCERRALITTMLQLPI